MISMQTVCARAPMNPERSRICSESTKDLEAPQRPKIVVAHAEAEDGTMPGAGVFRGCSGSNALD